MSEARMADHEVRRLGDYHTGVETRTVGVRMPVEKVAAVRAIFERSGWSMSEGIERLIDTQVLRKR